ncbi:hypothetical protein E2C01_031628 [Portunus trituberculatus]|uniref:Uncharacterized protein n=1 Tax=Portunus trituberculatus TaxID=210409 RepID=A0A5B7F0K7_PORTR|nr:hypothetical protein [Portunus trituberculatus]
MDLARPNPAPDGSPDGPTDLTFNQEGTLCKRVPSWMETQQVIYLLVFKSQLLFVFYFHRWTEEVTDDQ